MLVFPKLPIKIVLQVYVPEKCFAADACLIPGAGEPCVLAALGHYKGICFPDCTVRPKSLELLSMVPLSGNDPCILWIL